MSTISPVISASELKALFNDENLIILDARVGKDIHQSYLDKHIKGAGFIDLDKDLAEIGEEAAFGGRHPLPDIKKFAETLSRFGVSKDSHIIIYDDKNGSNAGARAWWMLRSFGIKNVQILDGGIQSAEQNGIEFSSGEESFETVPLIHQDSWIFPLSDINEVETGLNGHSVTVIDVRDNYRYIGESEPIDLIAGHIPGAINIPFSENLDENGHFLKPEILKEKYKKLLAGRPENRNE